MIADLILCYSPLLLAGRGRHAVIDKAELESLRGTADSLAVTEALVGEYWDELELFTNF